MPVRIAKTINGGMYFQRTTPPLAYLYKETVPPVITLNLVVAIAVIGLAPRKISPGIEINPPPAEIEPTNPAKRPMIKATMASISLVYQSK
jgi:hypothetical protein